MKAVCSFATVVTASLILSTTLSFGQASQSEMQGFPMPPPSGFVATKTFAYVGDYGYYTAPTASLPGQSANASDYKYVRYLSVDGKNVWVYGAWGPTPIPTPVEGGDACFHAHASYGVWGKFEITFPWFSGSILWSGWSLLGGGGMSGTRNANDRCVFDTNNSLASIDPRYGWGQTFLRFDFRQSQSFFIIFRKRYKELVVGALSNTHGWGSCSAPGFKACFEPSYIIGYTLP